MRPLRIAVLATLILLPELAAAQTAPCHGCPAVELVRESMIVHVFAEDDQDDPADLTHRVRVSTAVATSAWTDWSSASSYDLHVEFSGLLEAESRDLDGNIGRGFVELTDPSDQPIGPGTVSEDSSREARWNDDSLGFAPGVVSEDSPPPVTVLEINELEEDAFTHGACPDSDAACNTAPSNAPASLPVVAFLLLIGSGLFIAQERRRAA